LLRVFERSVAANNPKKMYFKLINICNKAGRKELMEDLLSVLVKKFKHSSKAWLFYMEMMLEIKAKGGQNQGKPIDLKQILTRSLQSIKTRKHLFVLTQYGILEFKSGECEQGRTTFEAIITNYPKR
jgi:rRNA biogenesis protein RRP5